MQTPNPEPTIINNRYRLDRQLGIGGMAEVHISKDVLLDRDVAVKILHSKFAEDESFITRFSREAQAAAKLSHPNIVAIHDIGQFENRNFIVMEYVEGQTLADHIAEGKTKDVNEAVRIAIGVASGLEVAHQQGTIHRDIKPCNILMATNGTPKIADFGIARALDTTNTALTQTGFVVGTPMYFSPEQSRGDKVDARSDLYSLGIVLYEMLNGKAPFTGDSSVSLGVKHATEQPPKANSNNANVSPELVAIIDKLLAKAPNERYENATELISALKGLTSSASQNETTAPPAKAPLTPPAPPTPAPIQPPGAAPQQSPTVISGQHQANPAQSAMTPPPQNNFQAPGGNVAPQAVTNYPQNQIPQQQATNHYQPPNKDKTSKILFIAAAVFIGLLATAGLSYFLLTGDDDPTTSASETTSEEEPEDEKRDDEEDDDDEKKDDEPEETTKATTEKKEQPEALVGSGANLEEISSQIQDTIGQTNDVHETISNIIEFPKFDTPDDSQIVGLDVRLRSGVDFRTDKPQLTSRNAVTIVTDETDIDALTSLLEDSITDWGEPESSETSKVTSGIATEVREISYSTDDFNVSLDIKLSVTDGQPAVISITHSDAISESDAIAEQIATFGGWSNELPFPEGGTFDSVRLLGGQSISINLDSSYAKDVSADIAFRYPGEVSEEDLKEKITDSLEGSNLSINDSRGSSSLVYVFGDSVDDDRSYYSSYSGSDDHTISFNTRVR